MYLLSTEEVRAYSLFTLSKEWRKSGVHSKNYKKRVCIISNMMALICTKSFTSILSCIKGAEFVEKLWNIPFFALLCFQSSHFLLFPLFFWTQNQMLSSKVRVQTSRTRPNLRFYQIRIYRRGDIADKFSQLATTILSNMSTEVSIHDPDYFRGAIADVRSDSNDTNW